MKQVLNVCVFIAVAVVLCGCRATKVTHTQAASMSVAVVPSLNIKQPVAIKNVAPDTGKILIGTIPFWKVEGDLYEYTESSIGLVKNIFEQRDIKVDDTASKRLELSVFQAKGFVSATHFVITTQLRAETGDGLKREYVGEKGCVSLYRASAAAEMALAQCVEKMLNDKDIVNYLEK